MLEITQADVRNIAAWRPQAFAEEFTIAHGLKRP